MCPFAFSAGSGSSDGGSVRQLSLTAPTADSPIHVRVTNLSTSSMRTTGAEMTITAFHSAQQSGVTPKSVARKGTYRIAKCSTMLTAIATMRYGFAQRGRESRLSFSESELHALNISITTSIESDMVAPCRAAELEAEKMPQSRWEKRALHLWKCVWR